MILSTYFDKESNEEGRNKELGPRVSYYDNGVKKTEQQIDGRWLKIVSAWDSNGVQTVYNGSGYASFDVESEEGVHFTYRGRISNFNYDSTWTGIYPDGKIYCRDEFRDDEFKKGVSYDKSGKQYKYNVLFEDNTANVTRKKLAGDILHYLPYKAEQIGQYWQNDDVPVFFLSEAYVCHLEICFDNTGLINDIKVLKSVNDKADEEIVYTVNFIKKVKPFILRGQMISGTCVVSLALPH